MKKLNFFIVIQFTAIRLRFVTSPSGFRRACTSLAAPCGFTRLIFDRVGMSVLKARVLF